MSNKTSAAELYVALAGNPNSGKTSLFNSLTGLRHKVGNYPGVTVERVEGRFLLPDGTPARVVDLPGCYSLLARSEDERIARDALLGLLPGTPRPDAVVVVVDATNLERNLFFATQLIETGVPVCVALSMVDVAERRGRAIDTVALAEELGVPVVPVVGRSGRGVPELKEAIGRATRAPRKWRMSKAGEAALCVVRDAVCAAGLVPESACEGEAFRLLTLASDKDRFLLKGGPAVQAAVVAGREQLEANGIDREAIEAESRYGYAQELAGRVRQEPDTSSITGSERADKVLTHKILGPLIYAAVLYVIFESVYTWAGPLMDMIEAGQNWLGAHVASWLGEGMLTDLLVDGVIGGVGAIVIFLPQICLLFFFLTLLEDCGYLARAAFLADRVMRTVGLNGKAVIPLMSSFACAIPGIMATRTMENRRDRFVTILVAPLMSCAARLPVYVLLIGAFIPAGYQGLTLFSMYTFSVVIALVAAAVLRRTLFRGGVSIPFILELPSYKAPSVRHVLRTVFDRGVVFVKQAGTVILAISIILWALAYFPRNEEIAKQAEARIAAGEDKQTVEAWAGGAQMEQSYAGTLGKAIEPAIEPLGFDWKIGVGLVASFAAREVLVSTLGIVYSVGEVDEESVALRDRIRGEKKADGTLRFNWLNAISLMVFFVLACQCMSTVAVVKRETNSYRWPVFMLGYMTVLAYVGSLVVFQFGSMMGWAP